jgi:CSLREA domain-containing protein
MTTQTIRFFSVITLIFSLIVPSTIANAVSPTVNSLADTIAVDGMCTLREAIQNANHNAATNADCAAGSGADTITFSVSGTITLGSALPTINDPAGLTLDGTGQTVTISGGSAVRVLYAGDSLTLNNMTIANGYATNGTVGGGIYHCCSGTLTIANSTFSGNRVDWEGRGGAIYNSTGALTITNSTFSGNNATSSGGGIYNGSDTLTITNSSFSGNIAPGGAWATGGGGIFNSGNGTLTITNCTFSDNSATFSGGGGIYCYDCTLSLTNSTFSGNSAGAGGGIYHMYNDRGTSTITNSTFSGNSANGGGGIFNGSGAALSIANSTFSSNSAINGRGGGIFNTNAILTMANSTFSDNSASDSGGAIGNYLGTMTLGNTIVANSVSGGNCGGPITNGGSNMDDGTTCGWGSASGSTSSTNPLLGVLTGSPAYFPLNSGSPAIDTGDDVVCAAWPVNNQSQNGLSRPQGAHCDIGSYESVDTTPPMVQTITRADTNPTSAASVYFAVTFSEAVIGVDTSDFALAVTGVTGASITAVGGGAGAYTVTVNTGSDSGTIRLDVVDNDTIVDMALNPLGGAGAGNGSFTAGETYSVRFYRTYLPLIFNTDTTLLP